MRHFEVNRAVFGSVDVESFPSVVMSGQADARKTFMSSGPEDPGEQVILGIFRLGVRDTLLWALKLHVRAFADRLARRRKAMRDETETTSPETLKKHRGFYKAAVGR